MPREEHEILASALEAEATLQEQGSVRAIGDDYDQTYGRVLEINHDYDESIAFAFTFWDNWVDASNHNWLYHDPITERDWPRFAREVAQAVRRGELPKNDFLVQQIRLKPRQTLWQWLKSLFGHAGSSLKCNTEHQGT
jgi:hypothetical protein